MLTFLSDTEYHARDEISSSFLVKAQRSIAHALTKVESTPAMRFGTCMHRIILREGGDQLLHDDDYAGFLMADSVAQRGETLARYVRNAAGMHRALLNNQSAMSLLFRSHRMKFEHALIQDIDSMPARIKPDAYCEEAPNLIIDLKTTTDASATAWKRKVEQEGYGYCLQAAYYHDVMKESGMPISGVAWVVVETEAPYGVGVYLATEDHLTAGRNRYRDASHGVKDWIAKGRPHPTSVYPDVITVMDASPWLLKQQYKGGEQDGVFY